MKTFPCITINRTKVELKLYKLITTQTDLQTINRTKVELKQVTPEQLAEVVAAINRTKVELKRQLQHELDTRYELSIVPKWN